MRISDWSSDVCSSDLLAAGALQHCAQPGAIGERLASGYGAVGERMVNQDDTEMPTQRLQTCFERCELRGADPATGEQWRGRSEEHTSELQSLMRISYAVLCS